MLKRELLPMKNLTPKSKPMDFTTDIIMQLSNTEIAALARKEIKRQLVNTCRVVRRAGKNPKNEVAHKAQSFIRDAAKAQAFSQKLLDNYGADARQVTTRMERNLTNFEDFVKEATPDPKHPRYIHPN